MSVTIEVAKLLLGLDVNDTDLNTAKSKLQDFGEKTSQVGRDITTYVTLPIAAAGAAAVYTATQFETEFAKIQNLVGITGGDLEELKQGVLNLAGETAKSPQELATALFAVTSSGFRGKEALDVLEASAKASAIGLGATDVVARAVSAAVTAFGESGLTAAAATDILAGTVRAGNLEAETFAPVLGRVIGLASAMGVSFAEVGASVATYTRQGASAEMATNDLAAILRGFLQPSAEAEKAAAAMGVSFDEFRLTIKERGLKAALDEVMLATGGNTVALTSMFGSAEAVRGILGTVGTQSEAYADILDDLAESTGLVDDGFAAVADTAKFKFDAAMSALSATGIIIGSALLPVITAVADGVAAVATWFGSLDEKSQAMILVMVGLVAAIGPLVTVIGAVVTAMAGAGGLMATLTVLTGPVGLIVAAVVAVVAAVAATVIYWDEIVYGIEWAWLQFKIRFLETGAMLLTGIETFINAALDMLRPMASFIGVDVPANVSIGGAALGQAALNAKTELLALETSHRQAKDEAAAMRDKIKAEIPSPDTNPATQALGGLTGAASGATGAMNDMRTNLGEEVPAPDVSPVIGELEKIETEGITPMETAFTTGAASANTELGKIGADMLREGGSMDALVQKSEDVFVGEDGMLHYVTLFDEESQRVLNEGLVAYIANDFVQGFAAATGAQGIGGAISRTAELFASEGPNSVKTAVGSVIGKMVGGGSDTMKSALGTAFSDLTQGNYTEAFLNVAGAIPGVGTAIGAVDSILQAFGLNLNTIIGQVGEGLKNLLGLGATVKQDIVVAIEASMRQLQSAGMSAADAASRVMWQFQESMERYEISQAEIREMAARMFGLGSYGIGGGFGLGYDPFLVDEVMKLADRYGMGEKSGQEVLDAILGDWYFGRPEVDRLAGDYGESFVDVENLLRELLGLDKIQTGSFMDVFEEGFRASVESIMAANRSISREGASFEALSSYTDTAFGQSLIGSLLSDIGEREFRDFFTQLGGSLGLENTKESADLDRFVARMFEAAYLGQGGNTYTAPVRADDADYWNTFVDAIDDGSMEIEEAFTTLVNSMNQFQAGITGYLLTDEEEAFQLQQFLDQMQADYGWSWAQAADNTTRTGGGGLDVQPVQVNVVLDGQVLATAMATYIPTVPELYGA